MALLKFFFLFILILFFIALFLGATFIMRIYLSIRNGIRQMQGHGDEAAGRQQRRSSAGHGDEERVIDHRDPQQANRKIFSDEEGEYVDFEEV